MNELVSLLKEFEENPNASDLHLGGGKPPKIRYNSNLKIMRDEIIDKEKIKEFIYQIIELRFDKDEIDKKMKELKELGQIDLSIELPGNNRSRVNIAKSLGTYAIVMRKIPQVIPSIETLGFQPKHLELLKKNVALKEGIILITGQTGSGKSTTLAALLNHVNKVYDKNIVTIEDPVEFVFNEEGATSFIQKEVGPDTKDFASGLRAALREDPDIIMIGEIRDEETAIKAMEAAQTGHIVLATLHTNSAADTVSRILGMFPESKEGQIREILASTLKVVLSQKLAPRITSGRILVYELMLNNQPISNLIASGNYSNIQRTMLAGREEGMITMENNLAHLVKEQIITPQVALEYANLKEDLERKIELENNTTNTSFGGELV